MRKTQSIGWLAVEQTGRCCGYCGVFVEDLIAASIDASFKAEQSVSAVGVCPGCGDTWEFDANTFIVTNHDVMARPKNNN